MSYKNVAVLIKCEPLFQETRIHLGVITGRYPKYCLLSFLSLVISGGSFALGVLEWEVYNLVAKIV